MDLEQLTELFKWMTIISCGLLALSAVLVMLLKDALCKMHAKLFGMKEQDVLIASYTYLGNFKVLIIIFNIVPYISLLVIG